MQEAKCLYMLTGKCSLLKRGLKYEVQHGLKIHETPGVGF